VQSSHADSLPVWNYTENRVVVSIGAKTFAEVTSKGAAISAGKRLNVCTQQLCKPPPLMMHRPIGFSTNSISF